MPVMDEFKNEREKMKNQPFKKKLSYFWTYYKWFVIGGLIAILIIVTSVRSFMDKKSYAMYGILLNAYSISKEEPLARDFEEYAGVDTNKSTVDFNTTLTMSDQMDQNGASASQFLMVYIAAKDLDITVMDPPRFSKYANSNTYMDLRELLDQDMLDKLSDKLYYVDMVVVDQINALQSENESTDDVEIPDPFHPEDMEKPVPVGIALKDCKKFTEAYYYDNDESYLGVIINTEKRDMALKFIQYLFTE